MNTNKFLLITYTILMAVLWTVAFTENYLFLKNKRYKEYINVEKLAFKNVLYIIVSYCLNVILL